MEKEDIERQLDKRFEQFRKKNYAPLTVKKVLIAAIAIAVVVCILRYYKLVQFWLGI